MANIGIILPEDMEGYPKQPTLYPLTTMPSLKNGTRVFIIQPDKNTAFFDETKDTSSVHGDFYNIKIGFNVRRLRSSIDAVRTLLMNRKVHVIHTDGGGKVRLSLNVRLTTDRATTDNRRLGRNQYDFAFTTRQEKPTATIPELSDTDNFTGGGGGGSNSGSGSGGGGGGNSDTFNIVPLAELEDGMIVRLRSPSAEGYTEFGTLLGTLARYLRQVGDDTEWKNKIGFTELISGTQGVQMLFDENDDPDFKIIE